MGEEEINIYFVIEILLLIGSILWYAALYNGDASNFEWKISLYCLTLEWLLNRIAN